MYYRSSTGSTVVHVRGTGNTYVVVPALRTGTGTDVRTYGYVGSAVFY